MGLYKEVDHFFNQHTVMQTRIYKDACDVGLKVSGVTDPLCQELREIFAGKGERSWFLEGIKKHREEGRYNDGTIMYSTVTVYLPWEYDGGSTRCTEWRVTYHNDPVRKVQFISFEPSTTHKKDMYIWEGA